MYDLDLKEITQDKKDAAAMGIIADLLSWAIQIYIVIIVLQVAVSWLILFDVINRNNAAARNLISLLSKATEPVYKPIRKFIPPIGGLDLTPLIVIIGLSLIDRFIN